MDWLDFDIDQICFCSSEELTLFANELTISVLVEVNPCFFCFKHFSFLFETISLTLSSSRFLREILWLARLRVENAKFAKDFCGRNAREPLDLQEVVRMMKKGSRHCQIWVPKSKIREERNNHQTPRVFSGVSYPPKNGDYEWMFLGKNRAKSTSKKNGATLG